MKKTRLSGVYIIENTKNNKVYIGASKDTYNRLCMHKTQLRANRHHNNHLQTALISMEKNHLSSMYWKNVMSSLFILRKTIGVLC